MNWTEKKFNARCNAVFVALCVFFSLSIFSCASIERALSKYAPPYAIFDSQIVEHEEPEIEFTFSNLGERTITCVKFFARVQEGGDSDEGFSDDLMEKEFVFEAEFAPGDSERIYIPLGEFEFEGGIEECVVETIFASEIIFSDGEVWSDLEGRAAL